MLMLTSAAYQPKAPAFIPSAKAFAQIAGWLYDENRRPLAGPQTSPCIIGVTGNLGVDAALNIKCKIRLFDAECGQINEQVVVARKVVKIDVMKTFARYIKFKIEKVWNSPDPNDATKPSNAGMSTSRKVTCTVQVDVVEMNTGILQSGEIFIAVKLGEGRSFMESDHRAGVFYINAQDHATFATIARNYKPTSKPADEFASLRSLTPAHEFGHVLGLKDRYAYFCYCYPDSTSYSGLRVIRDRGHTIPLYVHSTGAQADDKEYSEEYRWLFNLMSTMKPGPYQGWPNIDSHRIWDEFDTARNDYIHVHNTQRYCDLYSGASQDKIFISKNQLDCIANQAEETLPGSGHVYFKTIPETDYIAGDLDKYIFKGTFVGIIPDASNGGSGNVFHVVHDDKYDLRRNSFNHPSNPLSTAMDADDKMRYRCREVQPTWTTSVAADTLPFASGLINASLDVQGLAGKFSANTVMDRVEVPQRLRELLDIEHLDHRVCIRRFASNFVQQNLDANATLQYLSFNITADQIVRKFSPNYLDEIKWNDFNFKPPTDLFADNGSLHPQQNWANPVSLEGLFVAYNYSKNVSNFRAGKTRFYTAGNPPLPTDAGFRIQISDDYRLSSILSPQPQAGGRIFSSDNAAIASVRDDVWDGYSFLPDKNIAATAGGTATNWKYAECVLDYSARLYENRKTLIALVKNGVLKTGSAGLDPAQYSLSKCLWATWTGYTGNVYPVNSVNVPTTSNSPDNLNKTGRYVILRYRQQLGR